MKRQTDASLLWGVVVEAEAYSQEASAPISTHALTLLKSRCTLAIRAIVNLICQILFMIQSYKAFWVKAFAFAGRTSRADFWLAAAANAIVLILFLLFGAVLVGMFGDSATSVPLVIAVIYSIAAIVPNISIQVRRLRDAGHNPWLLLISLIPYVGGIILFIMYLQPSKLVSRE